MSCGGNIKYTNKGFYGTRGNITPTLPPPDTPPVRSTSETSNSSRLKVDHNSLLVISVVVAPRHNNYTGIVLVLLLRDRGSTL